MLREFHRTDRVSGLMQRELARLIQYKLRDPRVGMITISAVEVSRDMSHAKVYVSALGEEQEVEAQVELLNKAAPFLRTQLAITVKLRIVPQLKFIFDRSIVEGQRLAGLIDKLVENDKESDDDSE